MGQQSGAGGQVGFELMFEPSFTLTSRVSLSAEDDHYRCRLCCACCRPSRHHPVPDSIAGPESCQHHVKPCPLHPVLHQTEDQRAGPCSPCGYDNDAPTAVCVSSVAVQTPRSSLFLTCTY